MAETLVPGPGCFPRGLPSIDEDAELRAVLAALDPPTRDAIASELLRCRDDAGDELAEIIDTLTMHPEERRKVGRLLAEIEASPGRQRSPNIPPRHARAGAIGHDEPPLAREHRRRPGHQTLWKDTRRHEGFRVEGPSAPYGAWGFRSPSDTR